MFFCVVSDVGLFVGFGFFVVFVVMLFVGVLIVCWFEMCGVLDD